MAEVMQARPVAVAAQQGRGSRIVAGALHLMASAIGRKLDVNVRIGGSVAATDGKTIWIPALPLDDRKAEVLGVGFLFHEANHVRETDVSARPQDPFCASLWNSLEDARSDGLGFRLYPGAKSYRNELYRVLESEGVLSEPKEDDGAAKVLQEHCYWRLQAEYLQLAAAKPYAAKAEALARQTFPYEVMSGLDALLQEVPKCRNSHEVAELARRIRALLEAEAERLGTQGDATAEAGGSDAAGGGDATAEAGGSDAAGGGDATAEAGGSDAAGGGNATAEAGGSDTAGGGNATAEAGGSDAAGGGNATAEASGSDAAGGGNATAEASGSDAGGQAGNKDCASEALRKALQAALADDADQMPDFGDAVKAALERYASKCDIRLSCGDAGGGTGVSPDGGGSCRDEGFEMKVQAASNALMFKISRLLEAETRCRSVYQCTGTRLDRRRIAGIAVGNWNVFTKDIRGMSTDTAVMVLMDRSGSMRGEKMDVARQACYALALALERVAGVSVAVAAFPQMRDRGHVEPLLRFEQRCKQASGRFARVDPYGGTPLAEAMLWAGAELLAVNRERRLLLVMTDGEYPEDLGSHVVSALTRRGIECGGVGIGVASVAHIFPASRCITRIDQLVGAVFELMFQMLVAGARRP